jgi:RNA polymerase sigma factor (sigma-70 family)
MDKRTARTARDWSIYPGHAVTEGRGRALKKRNDMAAHSDEDLIERLRRGDESAFAQVYQAEKATVYGYLLRLGRDPNVAADLFQNVWLKLARHAPRLSADSHLRAWLITVARREYISFRRAQALDLSRVLVLGLAQEASPASAPDAGGQALLEALHRLSDADREVLLLAADSELDAGDRASALGISEVALRQRLARARRRLTRLLEAESSLEDGVAAPGAKRGVRP